MLFGTDGIPAGARKAFAANPMVPEQQYQQRVNHTGTLSISREVLAGLTSSGVLRLILRSNSTGGRMGGDAPFSGGTFADRDVSVKISPVTLMYPLMSCFMRSITTGQHLSTPLERPRSDTHPTHILQPLTYCHLIESNLI